jgi:tRNA modification GTPase
VLSHARQQQCLTEFIEALTLAMDASREEMMAEYLRQADAALGRLVGRIDTEEVLGGIFSRFCIGK